jgi:type I restriction enzyme M protein
MTNDEKTALGQTLWKIAEELRGQMNADDFRDYMLSFLFLKYLSDNYLKSVKKELGKEYPQIENNQEDDSNELKQIPLQIWYDANKKDIAKFEKQMTITLHYTIKPEYLWDNIAELARKQNKEVLSTIDESFKHIENDSFNKVFDGLFSEINLYSDKLGKDYPARNAKLCSMIYIIDEQMPDFSEKEDLIGDSYEYLISEFAATSGKKAGEFYTPQSISTILSEIVTLDSHDPKTGKKDKLGSVMDMTCGSGSLLLNVWSTMNKKGIDKIYGQESNITTFNLARMNMLLHGLSDNEFKIFHGDTLKNEWDLLNNPNPAKKPQFDAIVANPPFSLRWKHTDELKEDMRFKNYGKLPPSSAADMAFLLHGLHYLKDDGIMAIIVPHGVLFRSGSEGAIRKKLLENGYIDTVIGLPANLFYSTTIPISILVLKKCKKTDDVLFINASETYEKGKRQNSLRQNDKVDDIQTIIKTYIERPKKINRYARTVSLKEIKRNDYNLNITRYVSTAKPDKIIDLKSVQQELITINKKSKAALKEHNSYLKELGLDQLI